MLAPGDYEEVIRTLTFGEGQSFAEVRVPIVDNLSIERTETFFGNLQSPSTTSVMLDPAVATATILDNDQVEIGFRRDYVVREGVDNMVTLELDVLSGIIERDDVVIFVSTNEGTALGKRGLIFNASRTVLWHA